MQVILLTHRIDLSARRYSNLSGKAVADHGETLSMTKGHVALGGGDLALLGSGCLWTWPEEMAGLVTNSILFW